jgi:hypothetical protein
VLPGLLSAPDGFEKHAGCFNSGFAVQQTAEYWTTCSFTAFVDSIDKQGHYCLCALSLDAIKTFDRVEQATFIKKLKDLLVPAYFVNVINNCNGKMS